MAFHAKQKTVYERQLTTDDLSVLTLVSQQHAISLDHFPRFMAVFETSSNEEHHMPLKSTMHNRVEQLQHRGYIHLQRVGKNQPDWIWLTKKGMQAVGMVSSWKQPTRRLLPTLHATNTIRLLLTEDDPQISWLSQQQIRRLDVPRERQMAPTAEVVTGRGEHRALYVMLRLTETKEQLITRMLKQLERETSKGEALSTALWYYASADVARHLRSARTSIAELTTQETARNIWVFSYPLASGQMLDHGSSATIGAQAWSPDEHGFATAGDDSTIHHFAATGALP